MQTLLIIGATGTTGFYLTEYLYGLEGKYKIYVTGSKPRDTSYLNGTDIQYIQANITSRDDLENLPSEGVDCVVLLAGAMPARMQGYDAQKYIDTNITGTLNVLEYCRAKKVKKIIFTQSHSDVYGSWNKSSLIAPDAPRELNYTGDHAVYIISKCCAVDLIEHFHRQYGLGTIILRLPNIYSYWPDPYYYVDGIRRSTPYLSLIDRAIKGEPIEIWGDPTISKDMVYVKDFAQLVEKAISSGIDHGTYNAATGIGTSLEEQIRGIVCVFSPPTNRSKITYRPDLPSQNSYVYDISNATKELGYSPQYPYLRMLEDMKMEMSNTKLGMIAP
jgi:UDP-glucose 4-epimerase